MYKEKDLIKSVNNHGYVSYFDPQTKQEVDNSKVEFENGVFGSLKAGEVIKLNGMIFGNSQRLAGMFERQTDEEFMAELLAEMETYPKVESKTDPLKDWLS